MKWYYNLKIGTKLTIGFSVIMVLVISMSAYSVSTARSIDEEFTYVIENPYVNLETWKNIEKEFLTARRALSYMSVDNSPAVIEEQLAIINASVDRINVFFDNVGSVTNSSEKISADSKKENDIFLSRVRNDLAKWHSEAVPRIMTAAAQSNVNEVIELYDEYRSLSEGILADIERGSSESADYAHKLALQQEEDADNAVRNIYVLAAVIIFICFLVSIFITNVIKRPVSKLLLLLSEVADGNININTDRSAVTNDEIGLLTRKTYALIDVIKNFLTDFSSLAQEVNIKGDIEYRVDSGNYQGSYAKVVEEVNEIVDCFISDIWAIMEQLEKIGHGEFNAQFARMPGKKAKINETFDLLRSDITDVYDEIKKIASAAAEGNLNIKVDADSHSGDWNSLLNEMNNLVGVIAAPLDEINHVLENMRVGNFDINVKGDYRGEFREIARAVNETEAITKSYVDEIASVLTAVSDGDLTVSIDREYIGVYKHIKAAIDSILESLNKSMDDIEVAAKNVLIGSEHIAQSATYLADGTSKQASAIEELTASIEVINEKTRINSDNATSAGEFSQKTSKDALDGNDEMKSMVSTMEGIKSSSANISMIIKVIEDIAFQTNLLALNAAVEAARAGEHGKGFAVVAEEVRNLAGRSQQAAKETTDLIEDSISRVDIGMNAANGTAQTLSKIVNDVKKVTDYIVQIAEMSHEQAESIDHITVGINEISKVIQSNSSTSVECASSSEELNAQAVVLKDLVSFFTIKKNSP